MKEKAVTLWAVVIFLIVMAGGGWETLAVAKGPGTKIPPKVIMTIPGGERNRKFPVTFPHAKHKDIDCTICHHNAYETLTMSSCSAPGCHYDTKQRKGPESFFAAFHSRSEQYDRSCIDCHKSRQKGPTACKGCHKHKSHLR